MNPRRVAVAAAVVLLVATGAALVAGQEASPGPKDVRLIEVSEDGDRLWPYTSRHADFGSRTLAINLIVHDDPDMVRYRLERRSVDEWAELNETEETANFSVQVEESRVGLLWRSAHGSMRYTYVQRSEQGQWLPQRYQLHAGTYLGTRSHVRAYAPGGDSEWTAIQAHSEYWDYFRLRHTVTDVWDTSHRLESDFADQPLVRDVERAHATERGPTSDGITVVHVAWVLVLVSVPPVRRRVSSLAETVEFATPARLRSGALFGFALGMPLFVRAAGLAMEELLPSISPKFVAAPLYVLLVVGLPVGVYRLSDDVVTDRAVGLAAVGFLLGVLVDFVAMGVGSVAVRYAWHRLVLAAALGAIAGGSREPELPQRILVAGVVAWCGAVLVAALDLL